MNQLLRLSKSRVKDDQAWYMASELESTLEWTNEKEDELVELWQERPCLYLISFPE